MHSGNIYPPIGSAAAQARNPVRTYERLTTLGGVTLTNSNGANALSAYTSITTPANDLCGLEVAMENASSAAGRAMFYLRINGTTVVVPGFYMKSDTVDVARATIPVKIAAGSTVEIAVRTSSNSHTRICSVKGIVANATDAPGYSSMTALNADTGATLPGNVNVPGTDTWTQIIASVDDNYDAFMVVVGGTNALTGQMGYVSLGVGASPSSAFFDMDIRTNASEPYIPQAHSPIIHSPLTLGDIISAKLTMTASDAANSRVGLYGFKN